MTFVPSLTLRLSTSFATESIWQVEDTEIPLPDSQNLLVEDVHIGPNDLSTKGRFRESTNSLFIKREGREGSKLFRMSVRIPSGLAPSVSGCRMKIEYFLRVKIISNTGKEIVTKVGKDGNSKKDEKRIECEVRCPIFIPEIGEGTSQFSSDTYEDDYRW
jgi:hypothetical protein